MTFTAPARTRTAPRDPAPLIWAVAIACWVATFALTLTGGVAAGAHDHVIEGAASAWPDRIAAFVAVWLVMLGAMMLPTMTAMARLFTAVSARQKHPAPPRTAFYAAYVLLWTGFAVLALAGDSLVHVMVDHWPWLHGHEEVILGSALVFGGAYQLSPLKDACLRACRSPMSMVAQHYRHGLRGGWRLGVAHGRSCLGCCWALMLVMFATGVGSLVWMLGLTAVMTFEKTSGHGTRLVRPLGFGFVAAGAALTLTTLL